ncbi:hypothetical protein Mth01_57370 [Sphaerimonospora thailandensis]|uniref:Uncharacterized protein n=1 Tax=Sphaerimonospora thailandensis TaxID=795644 RepID=A0A8J3REQ6_9ACTN|nr:hypothetical protein Mth01_57370 [Sphaerimonospora thailandensis]
MAVPARIAPAGGADPVVAQAADRAHAGAGEQPLAQQRCQRREVVLDEFGTGGQPLGVGFVPSGGLEQAAGGGVDVVLPRAEDPHVSPPRDRRPGPLPRLQDEEVQAALGQVGGGGQPDRARADHHDR